VFFNFVVPLFHYIFDRAQWAAMDFGKFDAPRFLPYFYAGLSPVALLTALSMFFPALAEEVVFRGMVLPDFLQRYGLHRGIFLTGIFWAAIHFRSDSYVGLSVGGVLRVLIWRILFCLTLNYVFAWMTLRWHSVLPAAIAHFMSNALVSLGPRVSGLWDGERYLALWVLLAMLLYRVWPLETDNPPILLLPDQEPELAL
jgi:membrane protease YdiL (CAAX protease family)